MDNNNYEEVELMTEAEIDAIFDEIEKLKQGLTEEEQRIANSVNLSIR
jgi:hypothetical protein